MLFFRIRCVFGQHIILKVSEVKLVTENNEDSSRVLSFAAFVWIHLQKPLI